MASPWLLGSRNSADTLVESYASAYDAFPAALAALKNATSKDHAIYLLGWVVDINFPLDSPSPSNSAAMLSSVLSSAAAAGVTIRAMYDYAPIDPARNAQNKKAVKFINGLKTGGAVLDNRKMFAGTHHQKCLAVAGPQGAVAFLGGLDIDPGRWNWSDVHCRLENGAAWDVVQLFSERWIDSPEVSGLPASKQTLIAWRSAASTKASAKTTAQIVRTYGDVSGIVVPGYPALPGYTFAPAGEHSIFDLLQNAIRRAKRFIYCEDQFFFVSAMRGLGDLRDVLKNKIASVPNFKFVALICRTEQVEDETQQAWSHRKAFVERISSGVSGRVHVLQFPLTRDPAGDPNSSKSITTQYVHSKTWIVDDEFALIGSANCNRRGYSHDSEVGVGIVGSDPNGVPFAQSLRMQVWKARLTPFGKPMTVKDSDVRDFGTGLSRLLAPGGTMELYDVNGGQDVSTSALKWDTVYDPDGS